MHDGASVVGACSGTPLVYLKTRLGRFCLLIVFGLFKILHLHREVILSKCLYLCLHRSEWLGHPTWYHQAKSRFLYFLLSSHDDMMGKRKRVRNRPPHSSSPCQLSTRESCCFFYRVNNNKVARVPYSDSPCFPRVRVYCRARIICYSHLTIHVMR